MNPRHRKLLHNSTIETQFNLDPTPGCYYKSTEFLFSVSMKSSMMATIRGQPHQTRQEWNKCIQPILISSFWRKQSAKWQINNIDLHDFEVYTDLEVKGKDIEVLLYGIFRCKGCLKKESGRCPLMSISWSDCISVFVKIWQ